MSGEWQYLAANVLDNQVIAELPLKGPHFARILNDNGQADGDIKLDSVQASLMQLVTQFAVEPALTSIYAIRDGAPQWGGILWSHEYDSNKGALTLHAAEFGSYLAYRFIIQAGTWTNDMSQLASTWVTAAFADSGPPLVTSIQNTGNSQTVTTNAWEQHNVLDLVKVYHNAAGGYDWAFDTVSTGLQTAPWRAQFTVNAPRRGVSYVKSGVTLDYPGPVTKYHVTKDGAQLVSDLFVTGSGQGNAQLTGEFTKATSYVKMQQVDNNSDLSTQSALNAYGQGRIKVIGDPPPVTMTLTVIGDAWFDLGIGIGDEFTMVADDNYLMSNPFPGRVLQVDMKPSTDSSPELVDVTLTRPL